MRYKILVTLLLSLFLLSCQKDFSVWERANTEWFRSNEKNYFDTLSVPQVGIESKFKTESGILCVVYSRGYGSIAKRSSSVTLAFTNHLIDGHRVGYASSDNPRTMTVGSTAKGWQEILCQMPQGSRFKLFVPYEQAHGKEGVDNNNSHYFIPPYSVLISDIEIIDVSQTTP